MEVLPWSSYLQMDSLPWNSYLHHDDAEDGGRAEEEHSDGGEGFSPVGEDARHRRPSEPTQDHRRVGNTAEHLQEERKKKTGERGERWRRMNLMRGTSYRQKSEHPFQSNENIYILQAIAWLHGAMAGLQQIQVKTGSL